MGKPGSLQGALPGDITRLLHLQQIHPIKVSISHPIVEIRQLTGTRSSKCVSGHKFDLPGDFPLLIVAQSQ